MNTTTTQKASIENLWPSDILTIDIVPPVALLRQQATQLGQITQNILVGFVETMQRTDEETSETVYNNLTHTLYIVAPALGNYRYKLITIIHSVDDLYPVHVIYDAANKYDPPKSTMTQDMSLGGSLENEDQLIQRLRKTFHHEQTKKVMQSLIAQSVTSSS